MTSQGSSQKIPPRIAPLARFVWLALSFIVVFYYASVVFQYHSRNYPPTELVQAAMAQLGLPGEAYTWLIISADVIFVGAFVGMACLIYLRRGDNPVVYAVSLTMIVITLILTGLAYYIPPSPYQQYIFTLDWILAFIGNGLILLMIYTLPDGQFAPRWTRWGFYLSVVYLIAFYATRPYWSEEFDVASRLVVFLGPIIFLQYYRYRHISNPAQRQQTKWVLLGILVTALAFFAQGIPVQLIFKANSSELVLYRFFTVPLRNLALIALPASLGIASLRYRLWDVDLTLNRSLVLTAVSVLLAGLFVVDFFIFHALLSWILPANHEMIAGAIAAAISVVAFNPTRRMVRHFIDRRFYGFRFDLNDLRAAQKRSQDKALKGTYSGRELDGYRLGNIIGRGGMGEVYEGLNGAHPVAIKALPASYFGDETARRRFEREAQATMRLNHPNIVKVLGTGISDDLAYIILEYITGEDLKTLIQNCGSLSLEDTLEILRGIATAVDAVHAEGIVHRDLKPSNIMLPMAADRETYHPVLMDFGLARLDNSGSTLTGSGAIGTVAYMSPEQFIESRSVDYRADIYALGVMAYEMLAGKPPFEGQAGNVMFAHIQQPAPDIREAKPEMPEHVAKAIQRAMAKDATARFESASTFVAALEGKSN